MIIRNITIHHSGGTSSPYASSQYLTAEDINKEHKRRWNFKSSLGYFGGYNFVIESNGQWKQHRAIGEETAAQRGHNFDSISICVVGNFMKGVDIPTQAQVKTLTDILRNLIHGNLKDYILTPTVRLHLNTTRILPHRYYGTTSCYGTGLSDMWAKNLLKVQKVSDTQSDIQRINLMRQLLETYQRLIFALKRQKGFGAIEHSCWQNDERG